MASKVKFFADLGVQSKLNTQVDGDLTVAGDLTVTGTTLTVNSTTTSVGDSMFEFANRSLSHGYQIGYLARHSKASFFSYNGLSYKQSEVIQC